jgi:hypothetical protein
MERPSTNYPEKYSYIHRTGLQKPSFSWYTAHVPKHTYNVLIFVKHIIVGLNV